MSKVKIAVWAHAENRVRFLCIAHDDVGSNKNMWYVQQSLNDTIDLFNKSMRGEEGIQRFSHRHHIAQHAHRQIPARIESRCLDIHYSDNSNCQDTEHLSLRLSLSPAISTVSGVLWVNMCR